MSHVAPLLLVRLSIVFDSEMGAFLSLYYPLPLSPTTPQIRLLHIHPSSNHDDPIKCSLSVHNLDKTLEFTALSYEWGRPPRKHGDKPTVHINYLWTLEIQVNLDKALRHLRQPDKPLLIWVDAVCINQNDNAEKGQQVGLMAEIYGSASQTYVWLGPSANDSDLAMKTLQKVGEGMLKESGGTSPRQQFEDLTKDAPADEWNLHSPEELLTLAPDLIKEYIPNASFCSAECRILLSRSYWTRMWVQQEVVLSPRPVICCGFMKLDWGVFDAGLVFIKLLMHHATYAVVSKRGRTDTTFNFATWVHSEEANYDKRYISQWTTSESKNYEQLGKGWTSEVEALRRLRGRWPQGQRSSPVRPSFLRVIAEAHCGAVRHEVSNQHDRVYGLAGMACDIPRLAMFGFQVTYSLSCSESYANAARAIIMSGGVDLLAVSNREKFEKMPSWVPDWRAPMLMPRGGYPWETRFSPAKKLQVPDIVGRHIEWDDPLHLEGCIVDRVDYMGPSWQPRAAGRIPQGRLTQGFLLSVQEIISMSDERQKKLGKWVYNSETGADGALWRMPVADQHQGTVTTGGESDYLLQGYLGVMKDLDKRFILDTKMWATFRKEFNVEFEELPKPEDMQPFPPTEESTAEFNVKNAYYNMMGRQSGTRPFVGDLGYIGLVPDCAERGDILVLFRNAKFPYVLRKKLNGKQAGKYELVGEAYIHGIMDSDGEYETEFVQFELV
jgi:hypothetical protein